MNRSKSFDQAAEYYDQTRPVFDVFATHGIPAILEAAGPQARILDVGTGTGRISIPLLEHGADLIGCDLSAKMLERLSAKFPSARLSRADTAFLPFPDDYFDAVLTVHVMHLVGPWREALREFKRVLKPGGIYLDVRTYEPADTSIRSAIRTFWRSWLSNRGINWQNPGVQDRAELIAELQWMGAHVTEVEAARFPIAYTLGAELERLGSRIYSDAWNIPDAIYRESLEELRKWVVLEYGNLDQNREEEVRFAFDVIRFDN